MGNPVSGGAVEFIDNCIRVIDGNQRTLLFCCILVLFNFIVFYLDIN